MENSEKDYPHDIRNAISGIMGHATLLEQDLKDNPELLQRIQKVVKGLKNLNETLTAMMDEFGIKDKA